MHTENVFKNTESISRFGWIVLRKSVDNIFVSGKGQAVTFHVSLKYWYGARINIPKRHADDYVDHGNDYDFFHSNQPFKKYRGSEMEYINAPKIPPERWHDGETDRPDNTAPQRAAQALWDEVVKRGTPPEEIRAAFRTVCEYLLIPYIFE